MKPLLTENLVKVQNTVTDEVKWFASESSARAWLNDYNNLNKRNWVLRL